MTFTHVILKEKKLVLERMEGAINLDDIQKGIMQIWQDPDYDSSFSGLLDFSNAHVIIGSAEIGSLAKLLLSSAQAATGEIVILVNKPMETALSLIFKNEMIEKNNITIYSNWSNALNHFNLSHEEFQLLDSDQSTSFSSSDSQMRKKR